MSVTSYGKLVALQGMADAFLAAAGGSIQVRLYYNGAELSGNGYGRGSVASLQSATQADGGAEATIAFNDAATFTATGGDLTYDEVRYYTADGVHELGTVDVNGTITDGTSETMNPIFNFPRDDSDREGSVALSRFGVKYSDDATFNNGPAIANAIKAKRDGELLSVFVPPGRWHVTTDNIFSLFTADELEQCRGLHIYGSRPENEIQGDLQHGLDPITTLSFDLSADDQWLFQRKSTDGDSTTFFGIITFAKLHVLADFGALGSFINLGTDDDIGNEAAFRGLQFHNCYLSHVDHPFYAGATGRPWIVNETAGAAGCYVFDPTRVDRAVKVNNAYDIELHSCVLRGWTVAIESGSAENLIIRDCKVILSDNGLVKTGGGTVGVIDNLFCYSVNNVGMWADVGVFTNPNVETGYTASQLPSVGAYSCDGSGLTWSIAANSARLELDMSACDATRRDARYYLRSKSIVKITPTTWPTDYANADPAVRALAMRSDWLTGLDLYLALDEVDEDGADILYGGLIASKPGPFCFPVDISGDDAGLVRCCGVNAVLCGDEVSLQSPVWNRNVNIGTTTPLVAYAPYKLPIPVVNEIQSASNDTAGQKIIAHHFGGQNFVGGGVVFSGDTKIDHPMSTFSGETPAHDANYRQPLRNWTSPHGVTYKYAMTPGAGMYVGNNQSAEMFFRRATEVDPESIYPTEYPWVVRPSDGKTGRYYRPWCPSWAGETVDIRVWIDDLDHTSGLERLVIYDGVTTHYGSYASGSQGWKTLTLDLDAAANQLLIYSGWHYSPAVLTVNSAGQTCEVAYVGVQW